MTSKVCKWCAVPQCDNTSKLTPSKLFIHVPLKKTIRYKWLNLARRDPAAIGLNSNIYFCEDHFDLPNDMENYYEYLVMGSVSKIRMKPGCIPTKFECQPDRRKRTSNTTQRTYILKKQRKMLIEECEKDLDERNIISQHLELGETSSGSTVFHANIKQEKAPKTVDKSIQIHMAHKFRSKAIQTDIKLVNQMRPDPKSVTASPFKVKRRISTKPWTSTSQKPSRNIFKIEAPDSDYTSSVTQNESQASECSELIVDYIKQEKS